MHIALDATYLVDPHPSGIAVYSHELLNGLARSHPEDSYLHYYRLKQYKRAAASNFPNVRKRLLLPPLPTSLPWQRADIFHALNQRVDVRAGRRVVSTFHDLFVMTGDYSSRDFRKRFTAQARQAAARSDLIIAVSEFTSRQLMECLGVEPGRIRVVPHGVHLPAALPADSEREKVILCVGALQRRKNVLRLVEAFETLPSKLAQDWKLVLAGSTAGYGAAEILARIEGSGAAARIQLKGYVANAELNALYRSAAIFAFPSLDEGFGIPVLEAMAHGIPVVTSNRSALPAVAGDAALLVDPFQVDALRDALNLLMQNQQVRMQLAEKGLNRAKQFPWETSVSATHAIYQSF